MKYLNFKLWGPFYIIGLICVLIIMWFIDEVRPSGITLWIGSLLIVILVGFNFWMMRNEVKAHEVKEDQDRLLSGLEPLDRKNIIIRLLKKE